MHFNLIKSIILPVIIVLPLICPPSASAIPSQSFKVIKTGEYFYHAKEAIDNAQESLFIVMPEIDFHADDKNSLVTALLKSLVQAKRRGVFVFVLLNLDSTGPVNAEGHSNIASYFFLMDNGIEVHYDNINDLLASRFMVIDRKDVLVGSSSWVESNLENATQIDFFMYSSELANELIEFLINIPVHKTPENIDFYDQLYLPTEFAYHPNGIHQFELNEDRDGLALYIYLLKEYKKTPNLNYVLLDLAEGAQFVNQGRGKGRQLNLVKLKQVAERLRDRYALISYDEYAENENALKVTFLNLDGADEFKLPHREGIRISNVFFESGTFWELSLKARYVYMYLLAKESEEGYGTWFHVSFEDKKNRIRGLTQADVVGAIQELRKRDLILVEYLVNQSVENSNYFAFDCLIQPLRFKNYFDKQMKRILAMHSPDYVNQAVNMAEEMLVGKNINLIERLIKLFEKYPSQLVTETYQLKIKPVPAESPYKSVAFLEQLLRELDEMKEKEANERAN